MRVRQAISACLFVLAFATGCAGEPVILKVYAGEEQATGTPTIGRMGEIVVGARVLHAGRLRYYYTSDSHAEGFAHNTCGKSPQEACVSFAPLAASEAHLLEPVGYRAGGIVGEHTVTLHVMDDHENHLTGTVRISVMD